MKASYDLVVVGGGINGCGIARDAAGRGLEVLMVEQGDLGSGTSSASTKLIHGGLRYLEYYEFRLVRESLIERERLWAAAPHIIWPLRFVLPHQAGLRPAWLIRLGLFLYDHLGGRKLLPPTRTLDLRRDPAGQPLVDGYTKGFEYSDCWVEDSRLVVLNAVDAARHGADVRVRTRCTGISRGSDGWEVSLKALTPKAAEGSAATDGDGAEETVRARMIVNATGPWAGKFLSDRAGQSKEPGRVRLVQGSHIVLPRLFEHDRAYILQNTDGRIVFAIPYEGEFTLVGTTDRDYANDPGEVEISQEETEYLLDVVKSYFGRRPGKRDIVWAYSGVRPLYDDGATAAQEATRDYVLKLDTGDAGHEAPLLNIFGGKLTTYRRLAEAAMEEIEPYFPQMTGAWTGSAHLPGGDFAVDGQEALAAELRAACPDMPGAMSLRLVRAYGTLAKEIIGDAAGLSGLGRHFGADLYEAEVRYLIDNEWATTAEDVIWRRSKLGLRMTDDEARALDDWIRQAAPSESPGA